MFWCKPTAIAATVHSLCDEQWSQTHHYTPGIITKSTAALAVNRYWFVTDKNIHLWIQQHVTWAEQTKKKRSGFTARPYCSCKMTQFTKVNNTRVVVCPQFQPGIWLRRQHISGLWLLFFFDNSSPINSFINFYLAPGQCVRSWHVRGAEWIFHPVQYLWF